MRRLIAHIGLAVTALALVGATFTPVATKVNSNIEFSGGKELVFRVSPKSNSYGDAASELDEDSAKDIAKEMETRLIASDVTQYRIVTESNDTVRVILSKDNENEYEKIKSFLSFNGSFALTTSKDTVALGEEFLKGKAYLDEINGYPAVVIPFDNDSSAYKAVYEEAQSQHDSNEGETSQDAEGNESVSTFMYFWYDYIEGYDIYSKTVSSNEDYDAAVASKILMKFDITNPYKVKKNESDANELCSTINIDTDGDGTATAAEIRNGYNTARFFINLLNSSELSYNVDFIYERAADLWVDEIIAMDTHLTIAWSNTFRAFLIGAAVIALILAAFYKLGALSVGTTSVVSLFGGLGMIVALGAEFTIASMVALALLTLSSIACGIIYCNKLKEECYRGRSLKKANSEANRKAIWPIVDIHVAMIIIGAFAYLLGGTIMRSFAVVFVLGGLISLAANLIVLPTLMWLAANSSYLQGKYTVFGVNNEQVPDLMKEEKQSYFGAYSDKDFTSKKKTVGIIGGVLFVAALAGMIVSGIVNNGEVYARANNVYNSEIYLEMETTASDNSILETETRSVLDTVAANTKVKKDSKEYVLKDAIVDISLYNRSTVVSTKDGAENVYYSYYVVKLNKNFVGSEEATYDFGGNTVTANIGELLSEVNSEAIGFDAQVNVSLKEAKVASKESPKFENIILATFVGLAAAAVYLMLRYRLTRGIATLLVTCGVTAITAGIFAVLHLSVGSYVVLAAPAIALIVLIYEIMFMNKEREMINEDKTHDDSVENRNKIMVEAGKLNCTPMIMFTVVTVYLALNFFGFGPSSSAWLFLNILVGILVAFFAVASIYGPVAQFFYGLFKKVNISRPTKKKAKKAVAHKSAEPEEAIFIGIND